MGDWMRLQGPAGLPTVKSTRSYWHHEPSSVLLGHRTTQRLPERAEVVIIGSGITGTLAARELVAGGRAVLMLEAREACWGATGRNGGRCQPAVWKSAPEVARFELDSFEFLHQLVAEEGIECDWQLVGGIEAIFSHELLAQATERIRRLEDDPQLRTKAALVASSELDKFAIPEAIGAVHEPSAARLWPYKLVSGLLERLLRRHGAEAFNLQTWTPATGLQQEEDGWRVQTARGPVVAQQVLLASNGYSSHLLPRMSQLLVPVRGQVCALEAPEDGRILEKNYLWSHRGQDDYLVERQNGAGVLILGGERLSVPGGQVGIWRDDELEPVIGQQLRRALRPVIKLRPPGVPEAEQLPAAYEWTGIGGCTPDGHPWVGCVPARLGGGTGAQVGGRGGLWISAGYNGHGMPVAPLCAVAVARMMLGRETGVRLPAGFLATEGRAAAAATMDLPATAGAAAGMRMG